jgi:hypothetical protein
LTFTLSLQKKEKNLGLTQVKMVELTANLVPVDSVKGTDLGRLHPHFPADKTTVRYRRKVSGAIRRLEDATNTLPLAVAKFIENQKEKDLIAAKAARAAVRDFANILTEMMPNLSPEVIGECNTYYGS